VKEWVPDDLKKGRIPPQLRSDKFRFIKTDSRKKRAIEKGWSPMGKDHNPKTNYSHLSPEFQDYIKKTGDYGVPCGINGLIVIDCDFPKSLKTGSRIMDKPILAEELWKNLPRTFEVQSGSGGFHFYYFCHEITEKITIQKEKVHYGEIQALGQMVMGPGSGHPSGKRYIITNPDEVAEVTKEQIMRAISKYYHTPKKIKPIPTGGRQDFTISVIPGFPWGLEDKGDGTYRGSHPIHGSENKTNFVIDLTKGAGGSWFCHRDQCGGGPKQLLAIIEKIDSCEKHQNEKSLKLSRRKYQATMERAVVLGLAEPPKRGRPTKESRHGVDFIDMADRFVNEFHVRTMRGPRIVFLYNPIKGKYKPNGEERIREEVTRWADEAGERVTSNDLREIIERVKNLTLTDPEEFDSNPNIIHFANGYLDINTGILHEFSPDVVTLTALPTKYDPTARAPRWERFIMEVLQDEDIPIVQEYCGYVLYENSKFQKMLIALGSGSNGKGVLFRTIGEIVGKENRTTVSLNDFRNRFRTADLLGKLLNLSLDISDTEISQTGFLKGMSGEDEVVLEWKGKDPIRVKIKTKSVFSTNNMPITKDHSKGFYRRWIIIEFLNEFFGDKKDPDLESKLLSEKEGILNWMLEGLYRLLKNNHFTNEPDEEKARTLWLCHSTRIPRFIFQHIEITGNIDNYIFKSDMHKEFNIFNHDGKTLKETDFNSYFIPACHVIEPEKPVKSGKTRVGKKSSRHVWRGVRWKLSEGDGDFPIGTKEFLGRVLPIKKKFRTRRKVIGQKIHNKMPRTQKQVVPDISEKPSETPYNDDPRLKPTHKQIMELMINFAENGGSGGGEDYLVAGRLNMTKEQIGPWISDLTNWGYLQPHKTIPYLFFPIKQPSQDPRSDPGGSGTSGPPGGGERA